MFKTINLVTCLFLANAVCSAPSQITSNSRKSELVASITTIDKTIYTETVDCGSVAQLDIFRRARLYLLQSAPEDKLLLNDKEAGDLVSSAALSIAIPRTEGFAGGVYFVNYVITVECSNRKYRSTISHIEVLQMGNLKGMPLELFKLQSEKDTKQFQTEVEAKLKGRLEDLKTSVKEHNPF